MQQRERCTKDMSVCVCTQRKMEVVYLKTRSFLRGRFLFALTFRCTSPCRFTGFVSKVVMQISLHLMDLHLERMTALPAATTQLPENKTKPARQIQMVQSGRKHFGFYFHSELADLIARETSRDPVPFHRLSVINRKRD